MFENQREGAIALVFTVFAHAECYEPKKAADLAISSLMALGCTPEEIQKGAKVMMNHNQ